MYFLQKAFKLFEYRFEEKTNLYTMKYFFNKKLFIIVVKYKIKFISRFCMHEKDLGLENKRYFYKITL